MIFLIRNFVLFFLIALVLAPRVIFSDCINENDDADAPEITITLPAPSGVPFYNYEDISALTVGNDVVIDVSDDCIGLQKISYDMLPGVASNDSQYVIHEWFSDFNDLYSSDAPYYCSDKSYFPACISFSRPIPLNYIFELFRPVDGIQTLNVYAIDKAAQVKTAEIFMFFDTLAPCDSRDKHNCDYDFIKDQAGDVKIATNELPLNIELRLGDGEGSGISTNPADNNIRILVVKASAGGFEGNAGDSDTLLYANTVSDIDGTACNEFSWQSDMSNSLYNYKFSAQGGVMKINDISLPAGLGDGTYWLFVCVQDRSGNWSRIGYPATWGLEQSISLCNLDTNTGLDDTSDCLTGIAAPALRARIYLDSDAPDVDPEDPDATCFSDPCLPKVKEFYPAKNLYVSSSSIEITWKNPYDKSGIANLYYKLSNTPPTGKQDMIILPRSLWKRDSSARPTCQTAYEPDTECFDLTAFAGGTLYMLVEDAAGNPITDSPAYTTSQVNIDNLPPSQPLNFTAEILMPTLETGGLFHWDETKDNGGAGIKTYHLCWNVAERYVEPEEISYIGCGEDYQKITVDFPNVTFTFPNDTFPILTEYFITIWAEDNAGNNSTSTEPFSFFRSEGLPKIKYTHEEKDYNIGGVSPRSSSGGEFVFRIFYQSDLNARPSTHEIWLDTDGNGFGLHEKHEMERILTATEDPEAIYSVGTIYSYKTDIDFDRKTNGQVTYKFVFKTSIGLARNAELKYDATSDHLLKIDPYKLDFKGMLQVRNGYFNTRSRNLPTALVNLTQGTKYKIRVYSLDGKPIKTLAAGKYNKTTDRFTRWNLQDKHGSRVSAGIYLIVLEALGKTEYKRVLVTY